MSDYRRRLTLATIIFLPLTLLTGYFVSYLTLFSALNYLQLDNLGYEFYRYVEHSYPHGRLVRLFTITLLNES